MANQNYTSGYQTAMNIPVDPAYDPMKTFEDMTSAIDIQQGLTEEADVDRLGNLFRRRGFGAGSGLESNALTKMLTDRAAQTRAQKMGISLDLAKMLQQNAMQRAGFGHQAGMQQADFGQEGIRHGQALDFARHQSNLRGDGGSGWAGALGGLAGNLLAPGFGGAIGGQIGNAVGGGVAAGGGAAGGYGGAIGGQIGNAVGGGGAAGGYGGNFGSGYNPSFSLGNKFGSGVAASDIYGNPFVTNFMNMWQ